MKIFEIMVSARHLQRAAFCAALGMMCLASAVASAGEPAWWTEQKRACGLPPGLAYNSWDGVCRGSANNPPAPAIDYEAERRQREAERQRQAEEQAAFIRSRDAVANTLKGSSSRAMDQLKGLSGTDKSGLKGSGFDRGGAGLKELGGSANVEQKAGSQPGATRMLLSKGSNDGPQNKGACSPSQDPLVVDLCFLRKKPAVIDPRILKGMSPTERTTLETSAKKLNENLLPFDTETYQALANMGTDPGKTGKHWPGPANPGHRYLNPLIEPEKVKAYWDKVNAGLYAHAEAAAKNVAATTKGTRSDPAARPDADPDFNQAIEQIRHNQDKAEGLARYQALIKFSEFLEKQGGADWSDRIKNDKLFAARMVMERDALFKKMDQEMFNARAKALQQVTRLVKGWEKK